MKEEKVKKYILLLESNYRDMKLKGARLIDIDVIINELMKVRL